MNTTEKEILKKFPIGAEVKIETGFAWAGATGEVVSHDKTLFGLRPRVSLDVSGDPEIFIMKLEQARVLK